MLNHQNIVSHLLHQSAAMLIDMLKNIEMRKWNACVSNEFLHWIRWALTVLVNICVYVYMRLTFLWIQLVSMEIEAMHTRMMIWPPWQQQPPTIWQKNYFQSKWNVQMLSIAFPYKPPNRYDKRYESNAQRKFVQTNQWFVLSKKRSNDVMKLVERTWKMTSATDTHPLRGHAI